MKSQAVFLPRFSIAFWLVACLLSFGFARAATILIGPDINNGSFEYIDGANDPGYTLKIQDWDGSPNGEVDNWSLWTEVATTSGDSGTQFWGDGPPPPAGPTGVRFAFLQPGNAAQNLTTYIAQAGDTFTFGWDAVGTRNLEHYTTLVYFDGINILEVPDTAVTGSTSEMSYGGSFTLTPDSEAIGHMIGLGVVNLSGNWPEVDNFNLTVTPVPEPATAYLLAAALGFLVLAGRMSRRARD